MKLFRLLSTFTFVVISNLIFAQHTHFNAATLVGIEVVELDSARQFVGKHNADLHCLWTANSDYTQLDYSEYLADGSIYRSLKFEILSRYEEETYRRLEVKNGNDIFAMLFWKIGEKMVVYEFGKSAMVLMGEVEY
jgi:hypothetical protein